MSQETATAIVAAHLDCGGDYIETAPIYPPASVRLGEILSAFDRSRYKLGTKCGIAIEDGGKIVSGQRDFIRRQVEGELVRFGIDRIDLLQTHVTPADEKPEDLARTLTMLKEEGLVSSIGVSNCTLEDLKRFRVGGEIEWVQIRLSMVHRHEYRDIAAFCLAEGLRLNVFQVIERGQLLPPTNMARRENDLRNTKQEYTGVADALVRSWFGDTASMLMQRFATEPDFLAIAWALRRPAVGCVVLGATSGDQIRRNWQAANATLLPDALDLIDERFAALQTLALREHAQPLEALRGVVR